MTISQLENLRQLSQEQMISLIDEYYKALGIICETLVNRSKCHISDATAFRRIDAALDVLSLFTLSDKCLGATIDWRQGKITTKQYHDIVLGVVENE